MKLFVAALLLLTFAPLGSAQATRNWFIFLVKGNGSRGTQEELQAMQKAHIANFDKLHGEGKLFMAGPLSDPSTIKRGIVGVQAPDRMTLMGYFADDPYVTSGIMAVEAQEWTLDRSKLNTDFPEPIKMLEHRLAYLKQIRPIPASILKQHVSYLNNTMKPDLDGRILRNSDFEEVLIFRHADGDKIREAFNLDPLVRHGYVAVEMMPLWLAENTIKS